MREILFRGKDPENGVWHQGQYIHLHKTTYCFKEDYDSFADNDIHQIVFERMTDWGLPNQHLRADVDPATVGQYTGLTDKNGVKIFEGDILSFEFEQIGEQKAIVEYSARAHAFLMIPINDFQFAMMDEGEVIGNIHDNQELLKEASNAPTN